MRFLFTIAMVFSVLSAPAFAFDRDCNCRNDQTQELRSLFQNANIVGEKDNRCRISLTNLGKCSAKKEDMRNRNVIVGCPGIPDHLNPWGSGVLIADNVVCTNAHLFLKNGEPKGSFESCSVTTQGKKKQTSKLNFGPNGGREFKFPTELPEWEDQAGLDIVCIQLTDRIEGIKPIPVDYSGKLVKEADEFISLAAFQPNMETSAECKSSNNSEPIAQVCPKYEIASMGQIESVVYGGCDAEGGGSGGPVYVCVGDQPVLVALNRNAGKSGRGEQGADYLKYDRTNKNKNKRSFSQAVIFNENVRRDVEKLVGTVQMAKVPEGKPQPRKGPNREADI